VGAPSRRFRKGPARPVPGQRVTQIPLTLEASEAHGQFCESHPPDAPAGEINARERICECGCGVRLTGRQERFASRPCSSRWWDQQHPRINRGPAGPREGSILHAMLALLADGAWRTALEIADAVRAREHSVSARLAEARKRGYVIESDAAVGNTRRAHRFRLLSAGEWNR